MDHALETIRHTQSENCAEALRANGFACTILEHKEEVVGFLKQNMEEGSTVACGGSMTLSECGVLDWLSQNASYRYLDRTISPDPKATMKEACTARYYLMSSNAVTMDGMLYNVDGYGNRTSALIHGPEKVFVLCGMNKIVKDLSAAIERVETIAAPANAIRLHKNTPCVKTGHCMHCACEDCLCNQFVLTRHSGVQDRIHVLLIQEELGY